MTFDAGTGTTNTKQIAENSEELVENRLQLTKLAIRQNSSVDFNDSNIVADVLTDSNGFNGNLSTSGVSFFGSGASTEALVSIEPNISSIQSSDFISTGNNPEASCFHNLRGTVFEVNSNGESFSNNTQDLVITEFDDTGTQINQQTINVPAADNDESTRTTRVDVVVGATKDVLLYGTATDDPEFDEQGLNINAVNLNTGNVIGNNLVEGVIADPAGVEFGAVRNSPNDKAEFLLIAFDQQNEFVIEGEVASTQDQFNNTSFTEFFEDVSQPSTDVSIMSSGDFISFNIQDGDDGSDNPTSGFSINFVELTTDVIPPNRGKTNDNVENETGFIKDKFISANSDDVDNTESISIDTTGNITQGDIDPANIDFPIGFSKKLFLESGGDVLSEVHTFRSVTGDGINDSRSLERPDIFESPQFNRDTGLLKSRDSSSGTISILDSSVNPVKTVSGAFIETDLADIDGTTELSNVRVFLNVPTGNINQVELVDGNGDSLGTNFPLESDIDVSSNNITQVKARLPESNLPSDATVNSIGIAVN